MDYLNTYVYLIIVVKVLFILFAVIHLYLNAKGKGNTSLNKTIEYWKDRLEFVFILLMAFLLIYLFYPRRIKPIPITNEMKILLYLFGFILLITANWGMFIKESKWFIYLQQALSNNTRFNAIQNKNKNKNK
jgi:hypothetical protein